MGEIWEKNINICLDQIYNKSLDFVSNYTLKPDEHLTNKRAFFSFSLFWHCVSIYFTWGHICYLLWQFLFPLMLAQYPSILALFNQNLFLSCVLRSLSFKTIKMLLLFCHMTDFQLLCHCFLFLWLTCSCAKIGMQMVKTTVFVC